MNGDESPNIDPKFLEYANALQLVSHQQLLSRRIANASNRGHISQLGPPCPSKHNSRRRVRSKKSSLSGLKIKPVKSQFEDLKSPIKTYSLRSRPRRKPAPRPVTLGAPTLINHDTVTNTIIDKKNDSKCNDCECKSSDNPCSICNIPSCSHSECFGVVCCNSCQIYILDIATSGDNESLRCIRNDGKCEISYRKPTIACKSCFVDKAKRMGLKLSKNQSDETNDCERIGGVRRKDNSHIVKSIQGNGCDQTTDILQTTLPNLETHSTVQNDITVLPARPLTRHQSLESLESACSNTLGLGTTEATTSEVLSDTDFDNDFQFPHGFNHWMYDGLLVSNWTREDSISRRFEDSGQASQQNDSLEELAFELTSAYARPSPDPASEILIPSLTFKPSCDLLKRDTARDRRGSLRPRTSTGENGKNKLIEPGMVGDEPGELTIESRFERKAVEARKLVMRKVVPRRRPELSNLKRKSGSLPPAAIVESDDAEDDDIIVVD